jgi:hypothetical protein
VIEQSLRTAVLADPTLSSLLPADAVYPGMLPQGVTKPCVTYSFHDGVGDLQYGGIAPADRYTVTLRVYADTYGSCHAVKRALIALLHGMSTVLSGDAVLSCRVHNVFADYEDTLELYSSTIDLTLHTQES